MDELLQASSNESACSEQHDNSLAFNFQLLDAYSEKANPKAKAKLFQSLYSKF